MNFGKFGKKIGTLCVKICKYKPRKYFTKRLARHLKTLTCSLFLSSLWKLCKISSRSVDCTIAMVAKFMSKTVPQMATHLAAICHYKLCPNREYIFQCQPSQTKLTSAHEFLKFIYSPPSPFFYYLNSGTNSSRLARDYDNRPRPTPISHEFEGVDCISLQ